MPQQNALAGLVPKMDLVGPTVADDIQRAIWRYGADEVKAAVKEATKAKRGRKREPDWSELRDVITADARLWLSGEDPFSARSNYAIAKEFAERNPGHSPISTHKRIERKLSRGPYDRRWFVLVTAQNLSRNDFPYPLHLQAIEALAELTKETDPEIWRTSLDRKRAIVADYEAREGSPPSPEMTFEEVEDAVQKGALNALAAPVRPGGIFGRGPSKRGLLAAYKNDAADDSND